MFARIRSGQIVFECGTSYRTSADRLHEPPSHPACDSEGGRRVYNHGFSTLHGERWKILSGGVGQSERSALWHSIHENAQRVRGLHVEKDLAHFDVVDLRVENRAVAGKRDVERSAKFVAGKGVRSLVANRSELLDDVVADPIQHAAEAAAGVRRRASDELVVSRSLRAAHVSPRRSS